MRSNLRQFVGVKEQRDDSREAVGMTFADGRKAGVVTSSGMSPGRITDVADQLHD
jgi:glycine cleavage system aminomethyltransferase T